MQLRKWSARLVVVLLLMGIGCKAKVQTTVGARTPEAIIARVGQTWDLYTSVQTLMVRLHKKGFLPNEWAFEYYAADQTATRIARAFFRAAAAYEESKATRSDLSAEEAKLVALRIELEGALDEVRKLIVEKRAKADDEELKREFSLMVGLIIQSIQLIQLLD